MSKRGSALIETLHRVGLRQVRQNPLRHIPVLAVVICQVVTENPIDPLCPGKTEF